MGVVDDEAAAKCPSYSKICSFSDRENYTNTDDNTTMALHKT